MQKGNINYSAVSCLHHAGDEYLRCRLYRWSNLLSFSVIYSFVLFKFQNVYLFAVRIRKLSENFARVFQMGSLDSPSGFLRRSIILKYKKSLKGFVKKVGWKSQSGYQSKITNFFVSRASHRQTEDDVGGGEFHTQTSGAKGARELRAKVSAFWWRVADWCIGHEISWFLDSKSSFWCARMMAAVTYHVH